MLLSFCWGGIGLKGPLARQEEGAKVKGVYIVKVRVRGRERERETAKWLKWLVFDVATASSSSSSSRCEIFHDRYQSHWLSRGRRLGSRSAILLIKRETLTRDELDVECRCSLHTGKRD